MSDLSIRIKADAEAAVAQFRALAGASEYVRDRMAALEKKFKETSVDAFIDRQGLAAAAMTATGRGSEALAAQTAAYRGEIERLIKAGMAPQGEALGRLQAQYDALRGAQEAAADAAAAQARRGLADLTIALLDAEDPREQALVRMRQKQDQVKVPGPHPGN